MVNVEKFTKRLDKILEYYDLSAAAFAEEIQVGRSSISHILSGRNKPSLEFVLKVTNRFPEVNLYWLLNGKGNFPSSKESNTSTPPTLEHKNIPELFQTNQNSEEAKESDLNTPESLLKNKSISRIVIFYKDGTFESFTN
ncbi:helix-turn-helix transcriptional regulator [Mesonia sp. HuA40]|uniref:helix-turn-helix domain-containing protein n=1 Tax=Mesonia sp. HuA40 TaxID=2602761 RepID=UPI0011C78476|nr:helix-turn-helix transcriptional regulator [Mesonia sp. HuA40]TXK70939.1 helix-turn-helix domain-containing protein [Mesonia sp. HuA40]